MAQIRGTVGKRKKRGVTTALIRSEHKRASIATDGPNFLKPCDLRLRLGEIVAVVWIDGLRGDQ
jgi:hypothetical protein